MNRSPVAGGVGGLSEQTPRGAAPGRSRRIGRSHRQHLTAGRFSIGDDRPRRWSGEIIVAREVVTVLSHRVNFGPYHPKKEFPVG